MTNQTNIIITTSLIAEGFLCNLYIFTVDNLQPPGDSIDGEIKTGLNEDTLSSFVDLSIASGEEHCQCCRHINCSEVVLS